MCPLFFQNIDQMIHKLFFFSFASRASLCFTKWNSFSTGFKSELHDGIQKSFAPIPLSAFLETAFYFNFTIIGN